MAPMYEFPQNQSVPSTHLLAHKLRTPARIKVLFQRTMTMTWAKQREYPRFKAALPVELRQAGASAPLRAQTADICLGGCYIEMTSTQQISREVEITLWIGQEKVRARGVVVSNH